MMLRIASGSPLRRPMITASSMKNAMISLTARHVPAERRNVPMATKVTNLTIMSTLQVDGEMTTTTTGTTPAPASNPGNGSAPASSPGVGSSKDPCGFPVEMLKWQFIDIRRCAHCEQHMDTVTRTVPKVSNCQYAFVRRRVRVLAFINHWVACHVVRTFKWMNICFLLSTRAVAVLRPRK